MVGTTTHEQPSQPIDELITELRMLTEVLLVRVEPWLQASSESNGAGTGTDCRGCPFCVGVAAWRGDHTELRGGLADQGQSWVSTLRTMLAQHNPTEPQSPTATAATGPPIPAPRVQHITIRTAGGAR